MKIDDSGQRKTQRGVCSRAHGKREAHIGYKLSRGEGGLLTGLWHGYLAHRYLSGIPAWRRGLLTGLWHGHHAHRYLSGIPAWQRTNTDRPSARIPCPQVLQRHHVVAKGASGRSLARPPCPQVLRRHPGVAKGASGRSLARPPCPQVPQWHPSVAKSHLSKDKPVSARCKDQLSYCRAYRQTCRMVSYVGLTDRQTGLTYRQPYLKLSPAGSLGSSLPPTLPAGFVSHTFRPPDRQTFPNARPNARPPA